MHTDSYSNRIKWAINYDRLILAQRSHSEPQEGVKHLNFSLTFVIKEKETFLVGIYSLALSHFEYNVSL